MIHHIDTRFRITFSAPFFDLREQCAKRGIEETLVEVLHDDPDEDPVGLLELRWPPQRESENVDFLTFLLLVTDMWDRAAEYGCGIMFQFTDAEQLCRATALPPIKGHPGSVSMKIDGTKLHSELDRRIKKAISALMGGEGVVR